MLEKLPSAVGRALRGARPGTGAITFNHEAVADAPASIRVESPAFLDGSPIPARYTVDGAKLSPPLAWRGVPTDAAALILLVEDADSPTPHPLVHAIVWDLPGADRSLAEGALRGPTTEGEPHALGRNSYLQAKYLPPDPPPGHGPHHYAFQLFALDRRPDFEGRPGRGALLDALRDHVIARGCLLGTYERA